MRNRIKYGMAKTVVKSILAQRFSEICYVYLLYKNRNHEQWQVLGLFTRMLYKTSNVHNAYSRWHLIKGSTALCKEASRIFSFTSQLSKRNYGQMESPTALNEYTDLEVDDVREDFQLASQPWRKYVGLDSWFRKQRPAISTIEAAYANSNREYSKTADPCKRVNGTYERWLVWWFHRSLNSIHLW